MLVIKIIDGPDKGKRFDVPDWEPQLIGRSSEALKISDQTCSRRHAELTPDDGEWYVRDLGSANGTYVNGRRIGSNRVKLRLGDLIRAGSTVFAFGARRYGGVNNPVRALQDDVMDAIVEQRFESNEDSMIMAVPDPAAAAQEHLRIIYELTRITTQNLDRESLLEFVMELIFDEFEPERGFILIQERPDEKPEPTVVKYRTPPRSQDEGHIHVSRTIVSHVMNRGEGVLSSNAMKDRRFSSGDSVRNYAIRSAICVPIRYHDHTYGVIHIDTSLKNYTFSDSQLRLLTAIGQHVGLALSNLALYEQQLQGARLAAVGETVASLSHSIKNILQGLRGGADVVGRALKKQDLALAQGGWDILSRNLDRIYALTMNMLTYSKQRQVEIELTKLSMLLQDVVALVQPQCDRRGIALITDYDPDMPPIPLDPGMLHQALMNLLINSIEAVEPTTGIITLRCDYDMVDDAVLIHVSDNGPGIPESEHTRIWLPFHSTKGLRGTGLGLAVTRKIVEEHGGQISFESTEGRGTTFTVRLSTDAAGVLDPSETLATSSGAPTPPPAETHQRAGSASTDAESKPSDEPTSPETPFDLD